MYTNSNSSFSIQQVRTASKTSRSVKSQYKTSKDLFSLKTMNNPSIIRQNVGIDISKDTFVASIGYLKPDQEIQIVSTKTFPNQSKGFEQFLSWTNSFAELNLPISFVMEATGVYYGYN